MGDIGLADADVDLAVVGLGEVALSAIVVTVGVGDVTVATVAPTASKDILSDVDVAAAALGAAALEAAFDVLTLTLDTAFWPFVVMRGANVHSLVTSASAPLSQPAAAAAACASRSLARCVKLNS